MAFRLFSAAAAKAMPAAPAAGHDDIADADEKVKVMAKGKSGKGSGPANKADARHGVPSRDNKKAKAAQPEPESSEVDDAVENESSGDDHGEEEEGSASDEEGSESGEGSEASDSEEEDDDEEDEEDGEGPGAAHQTFASLGLAPWLQQQCKIMGMPRPTEIQSLCVPEILEGRNCIGAAKTGSGKTAAFALPILQKLSEDPYGVFSVVLTPTRELAFQIAEQFSALGKPLNLRTSVIVGGLDMMTQALELAKRPHVVIATPGRLADHINSSANISFSRVKILVLDEADRLVSDTFREHMATILATVPARRQTLLCSATMDVKQEDLDRMGCTGDPFRCQVKSKEATVTKLDQRYIFVPTQVKDCYLYKLLEEFAPKGSAIIFTSTCKGCESLSLMLRELDIENTPLHSKMPQNERLASLAKFRSSIVKVLVATDVASRGLDIPTVQTVINYDVPATTDDYIHRVGRTARAGRGGVAITIVTQYDVERVHKIEERTHKTLELLETEEDEVLKQLSKTTKARRAALITMGERDFGEKDRRNAEKRRILEGQAPKGKAPKKAKRSKQ